MALAARQEQQMFNHSKVYTSTILLLKQKCLTPGLKPGPLDLEWANYLQMYEVTTIHPNFVNERLLLASKL